MLMRLSIALLCLAAAAWVLLAHGDGPIIVHEAPKTDGQLPIGMASGAQPASITADALSRVRVMVAAQGPLSWQVVAADTNGEAVGGACAYSCDSERLVGQTDSTGLIGIPTQLRSVMLVKAGLAPVVAEQGEAGAQVRVKMDAGACVAGRIVDQDGAPVQGALVTLFIGSVGTEPLERLAVASSSSQPCSEAGPGEIFVHNGRAVSYLLQTTSNENGDYAFAAVEAGKHCMYVMASGYADLAKTDQGIAGAHPITTGAMDVRVDCKLYKVFVGCLAVSVDAAWPASSAGSLFSSAVRAPKGMALLPEFARVPGLATCIKEAAGLNMPHFVLTCVAQEHSALPMSVEAKAGIRVWGQDPSTEAFLLVSVPEFSVADVKFVTASVAATPHTVVVRAPVDLMAVSLEPAGFMFPGVADSQGDNVFSLPPGKYRFQARIPFLVSKKRFLHLEVGNDASKRPELPSSPWDGLARIRLRSVDAEGKPYRAGSMMISGGRTEAVLDCRTEYDGYCPCEPGSYKVTLRNGVAQSVATTTFAITSGEAKEIVVVAAPVSSGASAK